MTSTISASPSLVLLEHSVAISQGAEAKVYKAFLHSAHNSTAEPVPILLKHRFHKQYRHSTLDASLTKARVSGEARSLMKCLRSGVNVPSIRLVDVSEGVIGIEWIEGSSVRHLLPGGAEEEVDESQTSEEEFDPLSDYKITQETLMGLIGTEIAKMHLADVIHGDLTTSNIMLRRPFPLLPSQTESQLVLIDFGLAYISNLVEDKAVDLYVLERAFGSTHPDSEPLFASVVQAYQKKMGKEWPAIARRLDDVRLRGRKRSMVG